MSAPDPTVSDPASVSVPQQVSDSPPVPEPPPVSSEPAPISENLPSSDHPPPSIPPPTSEPPLFPGLPPSSEPLPPSRPSLPTSSPPRPSSPHNDPEVSHNDPHQISDASAQAQTTIEPGSEDSASSSGDDAGYASDDYSSTSTSLSSSVRDYAFENGRRYHKFRQGHYALPNDDQEQHREDMKHAMTLAASGDRLHFAPLNAHPQQIVDLGTGTGIWAVEMGDAYPSAQVLGIDLSPIQPTWVPPNVRFMVDDAESEWLHPRDHFDLVHARHCLPAFKDWAGVFASAFAHVKPGGWMEVQDLQFVSQCDDGTMPETYALEKLFRLIGAGFQTMGVTLQGAPSLPEKMRAAGFEGVEVDVRKVPVGKWPKNPLLKKVGLYLQAVIMDGLEAVSLGPICRGLKWTREEVEVLLAEVRKDLRNSAIHSYVTMYTIYGQKRTTAI